ncbi:MAG: hypothetical protein HON90_11100 [Halobacteriovoraceae bacterium]|jgi:D-3-phosphoglycerate dehydrogenase / 2-oxoglutarate reductase|nr:hypothetical protein [Halobacteriovoraceae bacterium]
MKLQVYRTNASSYQNSTFLSKEQRILEEIEGVKYIQSLKEMNKDTPFVLITNTHTRPENISQSVLDNTVLMIHPNSGHDNFNADFVKSAKFPIVLGNPIRANAVVEYTLSCLFHHFTKIPHHYHWNEERKWNRSLLRDQKVLILGHGHIGKILNQSLSPLCREVKVYDPFEEKNDLNSQIITDWDPTIFEGVSILLIAANLNPTSYQLIDKNILNMLAQENIIINPARGEIIKEIDLIHYLQKNNKSTCFLDVFDKEPFTPGYLNEITSLNKTSHIAGVFDKLNHDIVAFEYLIIKDFLQSYNDDNLPDFQYGYQECLLTEQEYQKSEG